MKTLRNYDMHAPAGPSQDGFVAPEEGQGDKAVAFRPARYDPFLFQSSCLHVQKAALNILQEQLPCESPGADLNFSAPWLH